MGIGTNCLIILIAMSVVMYIGMGCVSDVNCGYSSGVTTLMSTFSPDGGPQSQTYIVNLFLGLVPFITLGALALKFYGEASKYVIGVMVIGAVNVLFTPFTFVNELSLAIPWEVRIMIQLFFNIMLFIAVMSFVTEKEF